jgi:hypothetical protein
MIPTDDLTKREDEPVHYDSAGLVLLGYRFAEAVVGFYSGRREPTSAEQDRALRSETESSRDVVFETKEPHGLSCFGHLP